MANRRHRLLIVANRLPLRRVARTGDWELSSGGLVTALAPVLRTHHGSWIGWTGDDGAPPRAFTHEGIRMLPVGLDSDEVNAVYHGMCNRTLWPLYHDAIRTPEFNGDWWPHYVAVNQRFARRAAEMAQRGDMVWIHDYHLQLVPRMLRELRPDLRIGFFLHIPFPPEELFAWLPWRRELLEGLLGADVVGFQTYPAVRNFSRLARAYTDAEGTDSRLTIDGREVTVADFPISIDFDEFETEASSPQVLERARALRKQLGARRRIILSVDRLDYTKGIDARLLAFEALLDEKEVTASSCVLIQIAVPSRDEVPDYADMRERIERLVGRINGEHAVPGRVAVHYFRRSVTRQELCAYYRAADVMLVTPLRDGMNLVAKEYVASRSDNEGVLVLSEFAGAAVELRKALHVNPRDVRGMARTLARALRLPRQEARQRMASMRMVVRRHDVHLWANSFMDALRG